MVAVKAHQARAYLAKPDPHVAGFLFFGTDTGLVRERAARLTEILAKHSKPESEIVRLDESEVDADPSRIVVELQTLPMFGGGKIVRVDYARRMSANDLKPVLEAAGNGTHLVVEAGNLKPNDKIRSLFEKTNNAAAIGCYADTARDLETVINRTLTESNQTITMDARETLLARLGADRSLSLGELEKLTLYTTGKRQITLDDVDAIVGDASELALDKIINAAALGKAQPAVHECARALSSGETAHSVLAATNRHFQRLEATRALLERGKSEAESLKQLRPPLHFKQKAAFASQLQGWKHDDLLTALALINQTTRSVRTNGLLDDVIVERLLIRLAQLAQHSRRRVSAVG